MKFILILLVIIVMLACITLHELGHYFFGAKSNIGIKELSIGVGPVLFKKYTKKSHLISIRLFPIMAYVMLDSHAIRNIYESEWGDKKYYFYEQPIESGKILLEDSKTKNYLAIMFGGVLFNFICFLLFWMICSLVYVFCFKMSYIQINDKGVLTTIDPWINFARTVKQIGLNFILKGDGSAFGQIASMTPGQIHNNIWWFSFLTIIMNLSLLLFIINILPIPPLDGYKIFAKLYKNTTKSNLNSKVETYLSYVVVILLFWSFISAFICDIINNNKSQQNIMLEFILNKLV